MESFFSDLARIATLTFAVSSMLAVGFRYTIQEIVGPLRNLRLVIGAVVANFIVVPILAYGITRLMSFGEDRERTTRETAFTATDSAMLPPPTTHKSQTARRGKDTAGVPA